MAFDGFEGNTISLKWDNEMPTTELTIEYWYNILDPLLNQNTVFAYSAYNVDGRYGLGGAPYEQANEFIFAPMIGGLRFYKGASLDTCIEPECITPQNTTGAGNWNHVALSWTADAENSRTANSKQHAWQVAFYVNGELAYNNTECEVDPCDMGMPIESGGVITLGPEPDTPWGEFDDLQALTGVIDELRVWKRLRTDVEIRESYNLGIANSNSAALSDLSFYWKFDDTASSPSTSFDSSGHNNDALIGSLPTPGNTLKFMNGRAPQRPIAPMALPSTAGIVGDGDIVAVVVEGKNKITLQSFDPDGDDLVTTISSIPAIGVLTDVDGKTLSLNSIVADGNKTQNKQVFYSPADPSNIVEDSFNFTVNDGGADVLATVKLIPFILPTANHKSYTFEEDSLSYVALSKPYISSITKETKNLKVQITKIPTNGKLYQAAFATGSDSSYQSICKSSTISFCPDLIEITSTNTILHNTRGVVLFRPTSNEFSPPDVAYTSFQYKFVDVDDDSKSSIDPANVTIYISSVNDAPQGVNSTSTATVGVAKVFTLFGVDVDEYSTNAATYDPSFAPNNFAKISTFAKGGKLFQTNFDNTKGDEMDSTVITVPTVFSWASEVIRFSSQYSICPQNKCFMWSGTDKSTGCNLETSVSSTCRGDSCGDYPFGESFYFGDGSCIDEWWTGDEMIGPTTVYPEYSGGAKGLYFLSHENNGKEFIELKFADSVYLTGFELFECYKPGSLYKISSTMKYEDDNTVACCGEDSMLNCEATGSPQCSNDTNWNSI